ncbi:protein-disulfide reductase DsbD [Rhodanobacter sp. DHB23]|uniref:protein-disulfide reductase DsbD family protein n=1 Tax=Rhodanobacter sp. DHB23 TaxID=2775923 RepID=UPI001786F762|nr:protein-disulfide reductase DsbD [Rhodanobacter sp. DHB23]MBD8872175.1 protein-disulfide reductase DsbD [Rhodanobacter sp. DHB23]
MRLITGRVAARLPGLAFLLLGLCCLLAPAAFAQTQDDNILPVTEAYKLSADAGTPGTLKLHWVIAQDYYLYRGRMKFTAGPGVTLGEAQLPAGEKHVDPYLGPVETYHHSVDASIPYTVAPGTTHPVLSVQYQGCHEVEPKICYPPHTEQLDLPLPAAAATPAAGNNLGNALQQLGGSGNSASSEPLPQEQAFQFSALAQDAQHLLLRWTMPKDYYVYRNHITLKLKDADGLKLGAPAWPAGGVQHPDAQFGTVTVYFGDLELPVAIEGNTAGRRQVTLEASFLGCKDGGVCYPPMTRDAIIDLAGGAAAQGVVASGTGAATPTGPLQTSLLAALLLALGGGLILNLMPCVLPVLSLKAVSLLESGENPARRRLHALAYTAGVLASFLALGIGILALRSAGHALGWGTQLQQPLLVAVLACVIFALGLSMSGVVQFGASLGNAGSSLANRGGVAGDFFTGVLAVVVASPCTAPFMGGALAYAFAAPAVHALLVFIMLGVGLALPFLAIAYVPALARWLPKPGRWMETLKQVLAFPMYLTAAWLAWVLANQRGADAVGLLLVALVLLALALWWFERSRGRSPLHHVLTALLALATLAPLYLLAQLPATVNTATAQEGTVPYSPAKLAELRAANTPVFVDMTADWCITCKANEHAVLDGAAFHDALKRDGAVYMKGDWTNEDPAITAFLQHYHSPGVPLYVVFPKGGGEGRQLPTVLTTALVERALDEAAH